MNELGPILAIAQRDLMKLLRDRPRIVSTLVFPLLLIGILGGSLQSNLGRSVGFNFLACTFNPINVLPPWLELLSRISPMRYAVDLTRGAFYAGRPEAPRVVLDSPVLDLAVIAAMFSIFLV